MRKHRSLANDDHCSVKPMLHNKCNKNNQKSNKITMTCAVDLFI